MLSMTSFDKTDIFEFQINGAMTEEEFDQVKQKIEEKIQAHGSVRLIEILEDVSGVEPTSIWRDMKFTSQHMKYFTHVAVVSDISWITWVNKMLEPLTSVNVRSFSLEQLEDARDWIASD